jgi:asparagine synthase (glutamine-hydrolysing)
MCGICGAVSLNGPLDPAIRAAMPAMTHALRHRGPDGEAIVADSYSTLGHRRLAIIDRAGGAQPMPNEDFSIWVVFNGEIYNHQALRRELIARGHRFVTTSDTEAIVHAYEEYGIGCVERFEGMFAFAVYDQRRRELLLARDRIGKKPLFYAVLGNALHFASEIKALYHSPAWDGTPDLSGLDAYLSLGYFLAPHTVYRHVRKLEPGHSLQLRNGGISVRKYWDIERFDDDPRIGAPLLAEVETVIRQAVQSRLESEVPLGAFLSGGIDSGLVVSFMAESLGEPVVTTTVGFGDQGHNELTPARLTANRWGTNHHEEVVDPRLHLIIDPIVRAFDEPFADSSAIPTYFVSAAARRHVTVALSGDGGDETFGGYGFRYVPHSLEDRVRQLLPVSLRRLTRKMGDAWPRGAGVPRALRWGTFMQNISRDAATAYYTDLCFLKPSDTRRLMGVPEPHDALDSAVYAAVTDPYRRCPSADPVQRAEYADLKVYLANDVLVKVDRMSMAHSLEVRCPLLDRRVVELAFRIPRQQKMPKLEAKYLLRRLARGRLPDSLLRLPKHGFTAPVGAWIRGPYLGAFREEVLGADATVPMLLDARRIRMLLAEHCQRAADHSYALWAVWMLERWARVQRPEEKAVSREQLVS